MFSSEIPFGHAASHSPWLEQAAEVLGVHGRDHLAHPLHSLGLALGKKGQVRDLGGGEEHGGGVGAGGDARAAADAGGRVEGAIGVLLGHGNGVAVGRAARGHGDEAAGLDDPVERARGRRPDP